MCRRRLSGAATSSWCLAGVAAPAAPRRHPRRRRRHPWPHRGRGTARCVLSRARRRGPIVIRVAGAVIVCVVAWRAAGAALTRCESRSAATRARTAGWRSCRCRQRRRSSRQGTSRWSSTRSAACATIWRTRRSRPTRWPTWPTTGPGSGSTRVTRRLHADTHGHADDVGPHRARRCGLPGRRCRGSCRHARDSRGHPAAAPRGGHRDTHADRAVVVRALRAAAGRALTVAADVCRGVRDLDADRGRCRLHPVGRARRAGLRAHGRVARADRAAARAAVGAGLRRAGAHVGPGSRRTAVLAARGSRRACWRAACSACGWRWRRRS